MFSLKRIIFIILAVVAVGALFLTTYFFLGNSAGNHESPNGSGQREFLATSVIDSGDKPTVYIVENEDDEDLADVRANVRQLCEDLQLVVLPQEEPSAEELPSCDLLIFCTRSLGTYASPEALDGFLDSGGRIIMAAGIPSSSDDGAYWPILGVRSVFGERDCEELVFDEPLLPLQPEEVSYDGESDSTSIELSSDAKVFVHSEDDGTPLLYQVGKGAGSLFVINGAFLCDSCNRGLLTGAISALMPDFVYPVLGVKAVFLDDFPEESEHNDALCNRLYGYSTQRFVEGAVWPALQGMDLRTATPYTASFLIETSASEDFESGCLPVFTEVARTALQFNGELIYAADCVDQGPIVLDKNALDQFEASFPSYTVRGLALENGEFSRELLNVPGADIRCVRESATTSELPIAWRDGVAVFPAATKGNTLQSGTMLGLYATIGAYGLVSHVFDIESLITTDGGETPAWETDRWEIGAFESDILSQTPWLESRTLSQVKDDVQSYCTMEYGWKCDGEYVEIQCSHAVAGQSFFYHTTSAIVGAEGLSYEDLGCGFYLLHLEDGSATIQLEREG